MVCLYNTVCIIVNPKTGKFDGFKRSNTNLPLKLFIIIFLKCIKLTKGTL